jgi:hypothetical protein
MWKDVRIKDCRALNICSGNTQTSEKYQSWLFVVPPQLLRVRQQQGYVLVAGAFFR